MPHYGELLLWGVGALLVYGVFSSLYSAFTRSRRARQLGCGLPVAVAQPFWDPLGIVEIRKMVAANTNRTLGDWFTERHVRLSKAAGYDVKTASTSVLGNKFMFTEDPKNIQAILATQFKDFSLGAHRRGNFFPLLGNGIVSRSLRSLSQCTRLQMPDRNIHGTEHGNIHRARNFRENMSDA